MGGLNRGGGVGWVGRWVSWKMGEAVGSSWERKGRMLTRGFEREGF